MFPKVPYGLKSWPDEDYFFLVLYRAPRVRDSPLRERAGKKTATRMAIHMIINNIMIIL